MREKLLCALGITALIAWHYGNFIFSSSFLGDISPLHHELAEKAWFYSRLSEGVFAWFSPFKDLGFSLLADPTLGLVYLPNLLYMGDVAIAAKLIPIAHFYILGFGLIHWARSFERMTGSVAGLMLFGCGIVWVLPTHLALGSAANFPWLMLSLRRQTPFRAGIFAGLVFVLGDPFLIPFAFLLSLDQAQRLLPKAAKFAGFFLIAFFLIAGPNLVEMVQLLPYNARSLGLPTWEILSYSTNPARIVEILLPWKTFAFSLGKGFQRQWWFTELGGGLVLSTMFMAGVFAAGKTKFLRWYLALSTLMALLALGQFFAPSAWLFEHILNFLRFPERFLLYAFFASLPLVTIGLGKIHGRTRLPLMVLLILCWTENLFPRFTPMLVPSSSLNAWSNQSITTVGIGGKILAARVIGCHDGISGQTPGTYFDMRIYGVAMANNESSIHSPGLKSINCPWSLSAAARQWLGISTAITPPILESEKLKMESWGWRRIKSSPQAEIWQATDASPQLAMWVEKWRTSKMSFPIREFTNDFLVEKPLSISKSNCSGFLWIEPSHHWQRLTINIPPHCEGLVSLPWAYHPAIQIAENGSQGSSSLLRINSTTLGILISKKTNLVTLDFSRPFANLGFILSLMAQLAGLLWIAWRRFFPPRSTSA